MKLPVTEIFGPTVQGEGEHQGTPAYFIRFGGCDFRCTWCDTPHAVLPHMVRANERLTTAQILERLVSLPPGPRLIVLTGGNPALHELQALVDALHAHDYIVSVETQGSRWKDWLATCDSICVSPKPPSSEMGRQVVESALRDFFEQLNGANYFLKVVVFDQADYGWARDLHNKHPWVPFYLSAGNDAGKTVGDPGRVDSRTPDQVKQDLLNKTLWLVNHTMIDPTMADVRVQCQMHVLLWSNELGH